MIIFICGVKIGIALERIKDNKPIGVFTKISENDKKKQIVTEFTIRDNYEIVTKKKILKELEDGEKVHIKIFNYDEIEEKNN